MKKKNKFSIAKSLVLITIVGCFCSCNNDKDVSIKDVNFIEGRINDSIDVMIYLDKKSNNISTVIIKNKQTGVNNIWGFHRNGVTPVLSGREKDGMRTGLYLTYYSNGMLNNRVNYIKGEFDGEYMSFFEDGEIMYKAIYENGVEKEVEIDKTISEIEIVEFTE